jgi:O-antigen/teichoic acid export membrane protein
MTVSEPQAPPPPSRPGLLEKLVFLVRGIEMDRSVVYAALAVVRNVTVGPLTAILVGLYFTAQLQGYYYTLKNLVGFLLLAELGLQFVLVPFASHEWAHLKLGPDGRPQGEPRALSRLISLGRASLGWYLLATPLVTGGLFAAGGWLVGQEGGVEVDWLGPWVALCLGTALDFLLRPLLALLEGCNQVEEVFRARLWQGLATSAVSWLVILTGGGLWSLAAGVAASWLVGCLALWPYRRFLEVFARPPAGEHLDWWAEVWPMQWRMALSSLGGLLWTSLFAPLAFHLRGPELAGQVGMTLALALGLGSICHTWVQTRLPRLGQLVARRESAEVHRLLYRLAILTLATGAGGIALIQGGVWLLHHFGFKLAARLLPPLPTFLFLLATVLAQGTAPFAFYLRAHKIEAFLPPTLVGGILLAALLYPTTLLWGGLGMALGYLAAVLATLPWGMALWYRYRRRWYG